MKSWTPQKINSVCKYQNNRAKRGDNN